MSVHFSGLIFHSVHSQVLHRERRRQELCSKSFPTLVPPFFFLFCQQEEKITTFNKPWKCEGGNREAEKSKIECLMWRAPFNIFHNIRDFRHVLKENCSIMFCSWLYNYFSCQRVTFQERVFVFFIRELCEMTLSFPELILLWYHLKMVVGEQATENKETDPVTEQFFCCCLRTTKKLIFLFTISFLVTFSSFIVR